MSLGITYGKLPVDLGVMPLSPPEMQYWPYLPISTPQTSSFCELPDNLQWTRFLVDRVYHDCRRRFMDSYVYLTVRSMLHHGDTVNRPGWHSDGYGTDDLNYVWADAHPTEFLEVPGGFMLSGHELSHDFSMRRFESEAYKAWDAWMVNQAPNPIKTYPDRHLLRLDPSVVHRVNPTPFHGRRTFIKVSVSRHVYNLDGNAVNHALLSFPKVDRVPRDSGRNHPFK